MAAPHQWLNGPSFELGIDDDSDDAMVVEDSLENDVEPEYKDSLEFEDVSLLIVEDSLDKDGEANHVQDGLFTGEVISHHDDEVTTKKTESLIGVEGGASASKFKHHFDLNKVPNEVVSMVNVCDDVEEAMKSSRVKNLRQKVVQPYERAFLDLNKGGFDLNKLPDDGLDFGLESEELKKGVHDMLKIYLDSLY